MGVAGAAIATVAGQVISFFIAAWYIKSFQHIEFNKKSLRISLKDTKEMATIGMSASLNQIQGRKQSIRGECDDDFMW